jgi:hypothetical protein
MSCTWSITKIASDLDEHDRPNVIREVTISCTSDDESFFTTVMLDPPSQSFVDFNLVTQALVWQWVYAKISKEDIEAIVLQRIADRQTVSQMPW